jgi:hypothetical protein
MYVGALWFYVSFTIPSLCSAMESFTKLYSVIRIPNSCFIYWNGLAFCISLWEIGRKKDRTYVLSLLDMCWSLWAGLRFCSGKGVIAREYPGQQGRPVPSGLVWYCMPVIPTLWEAEAGGLQVWGHPGLQRAFKVSLGMDNETVSQKVSPFSPPPPKKVPLVIDPQQFKKASFEWP